MAGLAPMLRLSLQAVFLSTAAAQTAPPAAPAVASAPVSAKLNKLFAGAPPKYNPPKPGISTSAPITSGDLPRNNIVHLPMFIVRAGHLPSEEQLLTEKGRDAAMARRYAGPQTSLDRNLNAVNLTNLWQSIPLLGRIPFVPFNSLSYNQRAAAMYDRVEKKRRFGELLEIEESARAAEKPKPAGPSAK